LTVPSSPQRRPAASSSPRSRKADVVLPFVPVMPATATSGAKSCPSRVKPGTQKNNVPGDTARLS
jgi:hypothetical protein